MRGGALGAWRVGACGLALVLAGGCRDLTLPEGEGDAGLPRLVQVALLAPTAPQGGEGVPQRTVVRLGVESVAGLDEVELGCGGSVLAQWRPTGETSATLEREVDLGPCRPATLTGAGVAEVELKVTTVDATRLVARHGPFALPVHFAAPPDAPPPAQGPFTLSAPLLVGPGLPFSLTFDSHLPLAELPSVTVDGEALTVTFKESLPEGGARYRADFDGGLSLPGGELGVGGLERTVLLQVSARAVDGTRLQTLSPLKVTRVLWERLLPGELARADGQSERIAQELLEPSAIPEGLLMVLALPSGARELVKAVADTGELHFLVEGTQPDGRVLLGFDSRGKPLFSTADGQTPALELPPLQEDGGTLPGADAGDGDDAGVELEFDAGVETGFDAGVSLKDAGVELADAGVAAASNGRGAFAQASSTQAFGALPGEGTWQRTGERLCYDEVPEGMCGGYALVCLDDSGAPERLPTGLTPGFAPMLGASSWVNVLRLGFPPEAEQCCVDCSTHVLFGAPDALRPLTALATDVAGLPGAVHPDGQGGFLLDYASTSVWVSPGGELTQLSTQELGGRAPLALLEGGEWVLPLADGANAGLELRDALGKELLGQVRLSPEFSLRTGRGPRERALSFLPSGESVSLWSRRLPDGSEELYVLGTGGKLQSSWLYRYASPVQSGDEVWLVPETGGRHVYLVDFRVGRVVALVR